VRRVLRAFIPYRSIIDEDVSNDDQNAEPDLYSTFWMTTTLVLLLSMSSNLAAFFKSLATPDPSSATLVSLDNLALAAAILYPYVLLAPLSLFVLRLCTPVRVALADSLCVYGYALAPVVVAVAVCAVPVRLVQLSAMAVGCGLSVVAVMVNVWRTQEADSKGVAYLAKIVSGALHGVLGAALTFLFFLR